MSLSDISHLLLGIQPRGMKPAQGSNHMVSSAFHRKLPYDRRKMVLLRIGHLYISGVKVRVDTYAPAHITICGSSLPLRPPVSSRRSQALHYDYMLHGICFLGMPVLIWWMSYLLAA